jgi:hypothetical protein
MHEAILHNVPPEGGWTAAGANSVNIRVATVWVAEQIHELSGLSVGSIYRLIDFSCLLISLLLLFALLQRWHPPDAALLGVLLFSCLLPLTMFLFYFHPWDRPSLVTWILLVYAACERRLVFFAVVYVIAIVVKFDAVTAAVLPLLLMARPHDYRRAFAVSIALIITGALVIVVLRFVFPGGQQMNSILLALQSNLADARQLHVFYPPFLAHGLLLLLAVLGWRSGSDEQRRLSVAGLVLLIPHVLFTHFEYRAQVATTICLLPLGIEGLRSRMMDRRTSGRL